MAVGRWWAWSNTLQHSDLRSLDCKPVRRWPGATPVNTKCLWTDRRRGSLNSHLGQGCLSTAGSDKRIEELVVERPTRGLCVVAASTSPTRSWCGQEITLFLFTAVFSFFTHVRLSVCPSVGPGVGVWEVPETAEDANQQANWVVKAAGCLASLVPFSPKYMYNSSPSAVNTRRRWCILVTLTSLIGLICRFWMKYISAKMYVWSHYCLSLMFVYANKHRQLEFSDVSVKTSWHEVSEGVNQVSFIEGSWSYAIEFN